MSEKLDALPEEELNKIKSLITKGAKDTNQRWANALELVHTAYETAQVQRPDITMEDAWKQYEEMIQHAVQQLRKTRGMDGDWRMTRLVKEAEKPEEIDWSIETTVDELPVNIVKKSDSIEKLIKNFYDYNNTGCEIEMRHRGLNNVTLYFCKDGKRTGDKVTIRKKK